MTLTKDWWPWLFFFSKLKTEFVHELSYFVVALWFVLRGFVCVFFPRKLTIFSQFAPEGRSICLFLLFFLLPKKLNHSVIKPCSVFWPWSTWKTTAIFFDLHFVDILHCVFLGARDFCKIGAFHTWVLTMSPQLVLKVFLDLMGFFFSDLDLI